VTSGSVRIHPVALEEAEASIDWYRQRSKRAAEMFLNELDGPPSGLQNTRISLL